jgi:membrane protease YdiL (CAAX protease family)
MSLVDEKTVVFPHRRWLLIRQEYYLTLSSVARSSASWFFFALAGAAVVLLLLKGRIDVILSTIPFLVGIPMLIFLTIPLTIRVNRMAPIKTRCSRRQLWWQTGFLLVIILFITYRGIVFYFPDVLQIPVLYPVARWTIYFLGPKPVAPGQMVSAPKPPGHLIAIPVLEFIIPLTLLALSGARGRELGLGWGCGYKSWYVAVLWSIIPLSGFISVTLLGTVASPLQFTQHILRATFQSGFFEEFLFRGALLNRLSYLLRGDWGIVLSMLLFGFFYIGYQTNNVYGDWIVGIAATILVQTMVGLGLAVVYRRTRTLLASSIVNTLFETFIAFT